MKKTLIGLTALVTAAGMWEVWRHRNKKEPLTVKGTVAGVGENTFSVRDKTEHGKIFNFAVSPFTKVMWLANGKGGDNSADFSDLSPQQDVSVIFFPVKENAVPHADRIVIEAVK